MTKFMKFIPVALGLLALASCSNDDFMSDGPAKQDIRATLGEGDMYVTVADPLWGGLESITRGLRDFDPIKDYFPYRFNENDAMRVYDQYLQGYDLYEYRPSDDGFNAEYDGYAFRRIYKDSNIGTPMFALYPREDIVRGFWEFNDPHATESSDYIHGDDNHTHGWIKVNIAKEMKYEADYSRIYDQAKEHPLYKDRIPMFGKVTTTGEGYVDAQMEYLTGILCWEANAANVAGIKVELIDKATGKPLTIAGRFQTDLIEDNKPLLNYLNPEETDPQKWVVDEDHTARLSQSGLLTPDEYYAKDNDKNYPTDTKIIVNIGGGNNKLKPADAQHLKVFVPLVCVEDREVDLVVYQTSALTKDNKGNDTSEWIESWRKTTTIERGRFYWNMSDMTTTIPGIDICAVNDALATQTALAKKGDPDNGIQPLAAGSVIKVVTEYPIAINAECNKLLIPNEDYQYIIDMRNGVCSTVEGQDLTVQYVNPAGEVAPKNVQIYGKLHNTTAEGIYQFGLDTQLPKSNFSLVNVPNGIYVPVLGAKIDATAFQAGDDKEVSAQVGDNMYFSPNVKKLTVTNNASVIYNTPKFIESLGKPLPGMIVPDATYPGYDNSGLETIEINGYFFGGIEAIAKTAPAINLTVRNFANFETLDVGDCTYALAFGDYRVKGVINVEGRGFINARRVVDFEENEETSESSDSESDDTPYPARFFDPGDDSDGDGGSEPISKPSMIPFITPIPGTPASALDGEVIPLYGGVAAAYDGVNIKDQSFILGPVFTKDKNINIENTNFNIDDVCKNGGKLSDLIYELFNKDFAAWMVGFLQDFGYGPLYSETGSVVITAKNSTLKINNLTNDEVAPLLNKHAAQTVKYTVYANQDIDLFTENNGTITATGNMWAERDVNLKGAVQAKPSKIFADHDFAMEGPSFASTVTVGRNASVDVDEQDGLCEAIGTLTFVKKGDDANALFLKQGYIKTIKNKGVAVALNHGTTAAYTAIGTVNDPDNLVATENPSIWNGKQMPEKLQSKYIPYNQDNIWTATQLAFQSQSSKDADKYITTNNPILRSNIDLNCKTWTWDGITTKADYAYVFDGMGHTISNMIISSPDNQTAGFINRAKNDVTVKNLDFTGAGSKIARIPTASVSYGTGVVIGRAEKAATLERVKVKFAAGYFGSDGTNNLKSSNIGGAIGAAMAGATLSGVQVDAKDATLAGYYGIGGLIGKSKGNVVIDKNGPTPELEEIAPEVKDLKIEVTYVETSTASDLNQGKTGLYIGTAEFKAGTDGTPAEYYQTKQDYDRDHERGEKWDEVYGHDTWGDYADDAPEKIKTPAVPGINPTTIKIYNAQDATTEYTVNAEINGVNLLGKVFYHVGDDTFYYKNVLPQLNTKTQTMIGFCGKGIVNPAAIIINGKKYWIKIQGGNTYDLDRALYFMWGTPWE